MNQEVYEKEVLYVLYAYFLYIQHFFWEFATCLHYKLPFWSLVSNNIDNWKALSGEQTSTKSKAVHDSSYPILRCYVVAFPTVVTIHAVYHKYTSIECHFSSSRNEKL